MSLLSAPTICSLSATARRTNSRLPSRPASSPVNDAKMIVAGCGCPARMRAVSSSAAVPDVSSSAPGPIADRVVVAADDVDELRVDRALERRDDVGGLAAERRCAAVLEPLVLRRVAERLVGVEEVRGRQLVARLRDVLRVEVEERLLVAVDARDRRVGDDAASPPAAIGANSRLPLARSACSAARFAFTARAHSARRHLRSRSTR